MYDSTDRGKHSGVKNNLMNRHPLIANILIIIAVAILGLCIAYMSLAVFTKHGQYESVPSVENMSYSQAIDKLHDCGFRTEIRDSIYRDDVRPGYVVEQFPKSGSEVKPGRKIFLYINAVHPKEVIIDEDDNPREDALKSFSLRQGMARLEELGFKKISVVKVLGDNDCIVKVLADGKTVKKTQKVPLNANIVVQVYDGRLRQLMDSLQNEEYAGYASEYSAESGNFVEETYGGVQTESSQTGQEEEEVPYIGE